MTQARSHVPRKRGNPIPIYAPRELAGATMSWRLDQQPVLVVIVKASATLVADAPAVLDETARPVGAEEPLEERPSLIGGQLASVRHPSDLAPHKARADVVLHAHAHAPRGASKVMPVVFTFGAGSRRFERRLLVFGDRRWNGSTIVEGRPFASVPLTWESAFGGPDHLPNPVGLGHRAAVGADGVARLARVEDPDALIAKPSDTPAPASFAAVPSGWQSRWPTTREADRWLAAWPFWPQDVGRQHWQAAPVAQQLPYLRGDEPYRFDSMVQGMPTFTGSLPGVRARGLVERNGELVELALALDTVSFDAEQLTVNLVWRGHVPVADLPASDVGAVFALFEPCDTPILEHELADRCRALEEGPPAVFSGPPPTVAKRATSPLTAAQHAALLADTSADLSDVDLSGVDLTGVDLSHRLLARANLTGALLEGACLRGASLEQASLAGAHLAAADLSGSNLRFADLHGADLRGASFAGACIDHATISDVVARAACFDGARGERVLFERSELSGASFVGAELNRGMFSGALLAEADFSRAQLTDAWLYEVRAAGSRFDEATLDGMRADDGDFTGASFASVSAARSEWSHARLERSGFVCADLSDSGWLGVEAEAIDLRGTQCVDARFHHASLRNAQLRGANFMCATFEHADLRGADARDSNLYDTNLFGAKVDGLRRERALTAERTT